MAQFKKGDRVIVTKVYTGANWKIGDTATWTGDNWPKHDREIKHYHMCATRYEFELIGPITANQIKNQTIKGEENMATASSTTIRSVVSDVFENTKDAILIEKYLGHAIMSDFTGSLILRNNKEAYLKEAKRLEKEEIERNKK